MTTFVYCMLLFGAVLTSHATGDGFVELRKRLDDLEAKVAEQQGTIASLTTKLDEKCTCKSNSEAGLSVNKRDVTEGPVAFTAAIQKRYIDHVQTGQTVIFDSIITNFADGYNNATGVFTVPLSGIYMFQCSLLDHMGGDHGSVKLHAVIVKNGDQLVKVFAHAEDTYRDQGSNTVFVKATKGDQVWVKIIDNSDLSLGGEYFSSFSGYMLWQM